MPKVSVCIPAYEQVEYLKILLDSILNQKYTDYEIIITDDSKTDNVEKLVNKYNFEGKLKYFRNTNRLGSPENWNEAIRKAEGEYIKLMHHDEWFNYPDSLSMFAEILDNNPNINFAFSGVVGFNVKEDYKWIHMPTEKQLKNLDTNPFCLLKANFIGAPSNIIYRREIKETFNKKLIWFVDIEFYIRNLVNKAKLEFIPKDLITSVNNAHHSVTNYCVNNKTIEIFESVYIYSKYSRIFTFKQRIFYFKFLQGMFQKHSVYKRNDIKDCGIKRIPILLNSLLYVNAIFTLLRSYLIKR